jgi:hypothetical protein
MIKCLICNKPFKRLGKYHLNKCHNMTMEEYVSLYPNAKLISDDTKDRYASGTKTFYGNLDNRDRKKRTYKRTSESIEKMKESLRQYRASHDYKARYTTERNEKIKKAQKKRWEQIDDVQRSEMLKHTQRVAKERLGEEKFVEIRRINGTKGYEKFKTRDNIACSSTFEVEMYDYLSSKGVEYIPQYNVNGWIYDCYIPMQNLLLEFDGDFWHPLTEDDCKYDWQFKRIHTDMMKNNNAIKNGYNIKRIRLSKKEQIKEII